MRLLLLFPLLVVAAAPALAVVCPGGEVKCPDNMTCCSLANHQFGCCTFPEAQCCDDHVHCCPHDMKCDERHQACLKNGFPAVFFDQISVRPELIEEVTATEAQQTYFNPESNHIDGLEVLNRRNTCPDGRQCPSSFTCCKMYRGSYGCCPYADAKCCRDGFHCCPHGSQCNPSTGSCENNGNWLGKAMSLMRVEQQQPQEPEPLEVADPGGKCPDGHPCQEKFTCCKVQGGKYGCCPYSEAVCCTDLVHCCPKNTNCNSSTGTCDIERSYSVPAYSLATLKLSNLPALTGVKSAPQEAPNSDPSNVCPDHRSECRSGSTCCTTVEGSFACCPAPQATCCTHQDTCCPHGYQCAAGGICVRVSSVAALPFLAPTTVQQKPTAPPSVPRPSVEDNYVPCPDRSMCPNGNTCCPISRSRYGCCPMPGATCCGDMRHCCPHGYWCSDQGCERLVGDALNKTLLLPNYSQVDSPSVMLLP